MLISLCYELLSDIQNPTTVKDIIKLISHAVGFYGMIGGQVEDMYYEKNIQELDIQTLINLHGKKTGKLIEASILGGIIVSGEK